MNRNISAWLGVVFLSALVGGIAGAAISTTVSSRSSKTTTIVQQIIATPVTGQTVPGVADLYASVRPSVVKINAISTSSGQGATGSGVVLDAQGHIATNYHVVNGFNQIDAKLWDGTDVTVQVIGSDPGDDLAILKIDVDVSKLHPVTPADSSKVRVGDAVIAIGNPFDLEATLTEGIVSGNGRTLSDTNARPLRQLIQTDTAINPGNSGGGLFNLSGQLVGITNAIENPSGEAVFVGIGYAIPVSTLQQYQSDMVAGKTISHAKLGISLEDLTPALAGSLGLKVQQGVLVGGVDANSGAAKAGLKGSSRSGAGDVIVGIDGHNVKTFDDLANYLDTKNPGDKVTLKVNRNGTETTLEVTLDAWTS